MIERRRAASRERGGTTRLLSVSDMTAACN